MSKEIAKAILALEPNAQFAIIDEKIEWHSSDIKMPNKKSINAEIERQKSLKYVEKRSKEYPSIGDQLDALFKAGVFPEEMADKIQAIKDKYPKP